MARERNAEISFTIVKTKFNELAFDLVDYENSVFFNGQEFIVKQMGEGEQFTKQLQPRNIHHQSRWLSARYMTQHALSTNLLNMHVFKPDNRGFTWNVEIPNSRQLNKKTSGMELFETG